MDASDKAHELVEELRDSSESYAVFGGVGRWAALERARDGLLAYIASLEAKQ